jgi:hypothetical protein
MEVARAAEGGIARARQTLEDIRAFSELTRSCEGLCEAASSQEKKPQSIGGAVDQFGGYRGGSEGESPFSPFYGEECKAVGCWYGIGGEMVLARERQAAGRRPHGTGARKQSVSRGTAKMKVAADLAMEVLSDELATSLLDRTVGGNATIAKLLFALAEGKIDCEDEAVMERLCSFAERLASEPAWTGPEDEEEAETGFGEREPEA